MNIDNYGQIALNEKEAFDALYNGSLTSFDSLFLLGEDDVKLFNSSINKNGDKIPAIKLYVEPEKNIQEFDKENQLNWFMPKEYCPNLVEMLYGMCKTDLQKDRVTQELELFIQHGMFDLLFYLKYLVDTMRENNIVWGVGRGSSVASYVLYLIGIHKIDSIKYELDIREFLK